MGQEAESDVAAGPVLILPAVLEESARAALGDAYADCIAQILSQLSQANGEGLNYRDCAGAILGAAAAVVLTAAGLDQAPLAWWLSQVELFTDGGVRLNLAPVEAAAHPLLSEWVEADLGSQVARSLAGGAIAAYLAPSAPLSEDIEFALVDGRICTRVRLAFAAGSYAAPGRIEAVLHFGPPWPDGVEASAVWPEQGLWKLGRLARDYSDRQNPGALHDQITLNALYAERSATTVQ